MRGRWLLAAGLASVASPAWSNPEHLAPALRFGATDCAFCHLTVSGGEGHNERGQWLVDERERRGADVIDVAWLAERKTEPSERVGTVVEQTAAGQTVPTLKPLATDTDRVFDYSTAHGDWPAYGGGLRAHKYAPLADISASDAADLGVAWTWEAFDNYRYADIPRTTGGRRRGGKVPDGFKVTPLMAEGKLFVRTAFSGVAAVDPLTGETLWTFDPGTGDGPRPAMFGFSTRGLAYHRGDEASGEAGRDSGRIFLLASDGWLYALSARTGKPVDGFGEAEGANAGRVDLTQGLRRPIPRRRASWSYAPAICGDALLVGNQTSDMSHVSRDGSDWRDNVPLGDVRAFDVHTGRQLWAFKTVPQAGEFGNDTWGADSWKWMGNTNVWSMMSCDPELGIAYLPLTAPTSHFYGGLRPGDNLFSTSLVAVNARTGERLWHFQTVHHDIWDYDLPAAPVVADIVVDAKPVKAVAQVSKVGFLYVLDRVTGKPLWPVEERAVPPSDLAGEVAAKTQPFPTWPPPFEMQGLTDDDLNDLTPELEEKARETLAPYRLGGLFLPPSTEGSVAVPGWGGGANWGGAAFDPETRMLYVASRRMPLLMTAREQDAERFGQPYRIRPRGVEIDGLPVVKPPWSSITAYHLDTGEIAWQVANGLGPVDHPLLAGLELPDLGVPGNAPGLLVTKTAIFHGHRRGPQDSVLRVLDKATGALLAEKALPGTHMSAPPMAYLAGGRQFVVIATGAGLEPGRLTAFRLP